MPVVVFSILLGLLLLGITVEIKSKTRRVNSELGLRKGWCPENCKLTEETRSCGDVSNLRQTPNVTEICQTFLSDNFESVGACEQRCGGCGIGKILTRCTTRNLEKKFAVCKLPPKTGNCKGFFMAWYYDHQFGDCKKFVYGGCGGNGNRFMDHLPCLDRCGLLGILYPVQKPRQLTHQEL